MHFEPRPPAKTKKRAAGQVIGGIAAIAVAIYSGINVLLPVVAAAAIWLIGRKVVAPSMPQYLGAIAAQGAQLLWLFYGMAILDAWGANLVDVAIVGIGLIWLWVRPGIWPVALLTAIQLLAIGINTSAILHHPIGSAEHKSLVVHIGLRVIGMAAMWFAFINVRRVHGEA